VSAQEVPIRGEMIRLGQLLKLAGAADGGGEAKELLAAGEVSVNGEPEARRGRQLGVGDVVRVGEDELRLVAGP
jgi:ribosome-associated protein